MYHQALWRFDCLSGCQPPFMTPSLPLHPHTPLPEGADPMAQIMHNLLQLETERAAREDARERRQDEFQQRENAPGLMLAKSQEGTNDMKAFLDTFEIVARANQWPKEHKALHLCGLPSGAGMLAVANLPAEDQADMTKLKIHSCTSIELLDILVDGRCSRSHSTPSTRGLG